MLSKYSNISEPCDTFVTCTRFLLLLRFIQFTGFSQQRNFGVPILLLPIRLPFALKHVASVAECGVSYMQLQHALVQYTPQADCKSGCAIRLCAAADAFYTCLGLAAAI